MTREEEIKKQAEKKALEPSRLMHPYAKQCKVMSAYEIGFIEGAVWADEHPHWISVEDEYPPFDAKENGTWRCSKDVLIFAPFRGIFVGRYECDDMYGKTYWLFNGGSYPTVERGDGYESSNVTHWMPLPQPPIISNSEKTGKNHFIDANNMVEHLRETTKMIEKGGAL